MRLIWNLITCLVILGGVVTNKGESKTTANVRINEGVNDWRQYIQGYKVIAYCSGKAKVTINGHDVPTPIQLNRNTTLGTYHCNNGNDSYTFRIGYILCDPGKIAPEKVCPNGSFCVINGSSTSCQERLDCEGIKNHPVECLNGRIAKASDVTCSVYNNAHNVPRSYYLELLGAGNDSCKGCPCFSYKGKSVEHLSTISVSGARELQRDLWSWPQSNDSEPYLYCYIIRTKAPRISLSFNTSDLRAVQHKRPPAKRNVFCKARYAGNVWGKMKFYILFYEKNRAQFGIVQQSSNIIVNITNNTDQEVWLDPSAPFNCTVSIAGGLFIKALSTETSEYIEPNLRNDSIQMEYNNTPNAIYTCTAEVYYYEQFPPDQNGFKLLYNESRHWSVRARTTRSTTRVHSMTEQSIVAGGITTKEGISGMSGKLIGICVGSILGTILLVIIAVLAIRAYRKHRMKRPAKEEHIPFRSVRAPETDHFKTMMTERSAAIVTASALQPNEGTDLSRLFHQGKPASRKRTGSHGTASSNMRRSTQRIEARKPSASRRGTGTIESKLGHRDRVGSHGTASSQGTAAGGHGTAQKRAGSIDPQTDSASVI